MGAVAEGSPSIRAQANLSALGLHEMAASLPDYVRMVAAGERGFASALEEMTRVDWLHWCGQFREGHKRREGRI